METRADFLLLPAVSLSSGIGFFTVHSETGLFPARPESGYFPIIQNRAVSRSPRIGLFPILSEIRVVSRPSEIRRFPAYPESSGFPPIRNREVFRLSAIGRFPLILNLLKDDQFRQNRTGSTAWG